jgi:hypothetical protein
MPPSPACIARLNKELQQLVQPNPLDEWNRPCVRRNSPLAWHCTLTLHESWPPRAHTRMLHNEQTGPFVEGSSFVTMCASDARRSSSRRQASARGPRMDRSISSRPVRDPYHPPTMLENDTIRGPRRFTSLSLMNPRKLPGLIKPLLRPDAMYSP